MIRMAGAVGVMIGLLLAPGAAAKTGWPIELKKVKPQLVLCKVVVTTRADLGRDLGRAFGQLDAFLKANKVAAAGPPLAIYKTPPGARWRIEACWPIRKALTASRPFQIQKLAGGSAAVLTFRGPFKDLTPVYLALWKWINHKGYKPSGPPREIYAAMPPAVKDPKKFLTLIVWPVEQVRCSPQ
jgi:effector-binding domain-containing protein